MLFRTKTVCKFVGKEINERSHEECRDYRACSDDCADTVNGGTGEEVESELCIVIIIFVMNQVVRTDLIHGLYEYLHLCHSARELY